DRAVLALDPLELGDAVQVDDVGKPRQTHREQWHQALPAREHLRVVAVLSKQRGDISDALGCVVLERGWFHRRLPGQRRPTVALDRARPHPGHRHAVGSVSVLSTSVTTTRPADGDGDVQPAIPAATVVLVRDGVDGLETLMLRRDAQLVFAGGAWVFP